MKNSYDEIKELLKASRSLQKKDRSLEEIREMWTNNTDGIISEQDVMKPVGVGKDIEDEILNDTEKKPKDKQQKYRISGGFIIIHGKKTSDLQLTSDEKVAFQDTMNEFIDEVTSLVDFYPLNIYDNTVEWSGKIIDLDLEYIFSVGETNGLFLNGTMNKVDDEYLSFIDKLQKFYEKYRMKWGKIISSRRKTEPTL